MTKPVIDDSLAFLVTFTLTGHDQEIKDPMWLMLFVLIGHDKECKRPDCKDLNVLKGLSGASFDFHRKSNKFLEFVSDLLLKAFY